ncbi:MAG: Hsp70 family protein, partial [Pirellulaceae bacterium]
MADSSTDFDPLVDRAPARYVVGIDLGTTNSAVCYVDMQESPWQVRLLAIPQLVAANQVESRDTLPSFHFQSPPQNLAKGSLRLPWYTDDQDWCVGVMAQDEGVKSPGRLIASAKSWLCHSGVDRAAKLLPWHGAADVDRLSPVDASGRYLGHIRDAWNAKFKKDALAEQDIVITLPASFDEVARELTVDAASIAELPNVVLIEEPQAAFYAWVYKHDKEWPGLVSAGDTILVCDIGGGTSDFTLIKVRKSDDEAASQRVQFHRVAVGDHLILGGDNLDIALAHHLEAKLSGDGKLTPRQWDVLVRSCRRVKETLLGENAPEQATVNVPGSGTRLIGGGLQTQVTREEVQELLVDGFLPRTSISEMPVKGQSGFREFGLPFASDPAITRHLAAFLKAHGEVANADNGNVSAAARPDVVLFNGGFFASPLLRERSLEVLSNWFADQSQDNWQPTVLDNDRLDLA